MPAPVSRPPASPASAPAAPAGGSRWLTYAAAAVLAVAVWLVYANSLSAPFIFDDTSAIADNPTIRQLWPPGDVLSPPPRATGAAGRPIVNLSLALNYAIGGLNVRGYHVFNLGVHLAATLLLFGLVRRTLQRPGLRGRFGADAFWLGGVIALLWAVHPLLTESVTCVIQRSELLGALFYLLTLYAFARGTGEPASRRWLVASVLACIIGVAAKEIVATVPLIVLLYDRTFVAGTFSAAWRRRRGYYVGLACSWLLLAVLMVGNEKRGGTVGFGLGVSAWHYALTQCNAILLYLRLAVWPAPLVVDYGTQVVRSLAAVWWQALLLLGLVGGTLLAVARKPAVGFVAFTFFAILAPSSSFVPLVTQPIAEHRMYLPLAAVVTLAVLVAYRWWTKWALATAAGLAVLAGLVTVDRNFDYRSAIALWTDTIAKRPDNARAHVNLGSTYATAGQIDAAVHEFRRALELEPGNAQAYYGLGNAASHRGFFAEAIPLFRQALELQSDWAVAHYALANSLIRTGQVQEGLEHYRRAEQLTPHDVDVLHAYASALAYAGERPAALEKYEAALRLAPEDVSLHQELGLLLARMGRGADALPHLRFVAQRAPDQIPARYALGHVLLAGGKAAEAAEEFRAVVRTAPDLAEAHNDLGLAFLALRRWTDARVEFETALRLNPALDDASRNLERARFAESSTR